MMMVRPAWMSFRVFALLMVVGLIGYQSFQAVRWREHEDSETGIALELRPLRQTIKVGELPIFKATLVNRGNQPVVLVQPGDGSELGRRTPSIEWSTSGWFHIGMCGNINALKATEVFTLQPGETQSLNEWVGRPRVKGRGPHRVALRYINDPAQPFRGLPFGPHDEDALRALRDSTNASVVSNTVEVIIED